MDIQGEMVSSSEIQSNFVFCDKLGSNKYFGSEVTKLLGLPWYAYDAGNS